MKNLTLTARKNELERILEKGIKQFKTRHYFGFFLAVLSLIALFISLPTVQLSLRDDLRDSLGVTVYLLAAISIAYSFYRTRKDIRKPQLEVIIPSWMLYFNIVVSTFFMPVGAALIIHVFSNPTLIDSIWYITIPTLITSLFFIPMPSNQAVKQLESIQMVKTLIKQMETRIDTDNKLNADSRGDST